MNERLSGTEASVYGIHTAQGYANIAAREGDHAAADAHFGTALALAEQLLRPNHRYTLRLKHDYGVFLTASGRRQEAVEVLQWVLEQRRALLPDTHPEVARTRRALDVLR